MLASRSCMGGRSLKAGRSRRVAGRSRRGCAKCVCRGCACNMVGLWGGWGAAGAEGRAATVGSYGMSQRVREAACMVPDAWQSTWVGDLTEWADARARASRARKFARRGKKGLGALAARNLGSRRLRRWDTRREALCGQAGGPLPREGARGRSMPGQGVGAHHTEQGQVGRDRSRVCVGSTVAMGWTPPKVARGAGKAQKRACAAAAALCAPTIDAQKVGHAGFCAYKMQNEALRRSGTSTRRMTSSRGVQSCRA